jgi:hypothetical protein
MPVFMPVQDDSKSGVSEEARAVDGAERNIAVHWEASRALFGRKEDALSELASVAEECERDDWDEEGAMGLHPDAVLAAQRFIRALPDDFPLPEIAPEPDGYISLDWIKSKSRMFSVSIGANSLLPFAWRNGVDKGHAVAYFDGRTIPLTLLGDLKGVLDHGRVEFGAA